jgi:predicted alpha-1,2-mannosidase
MKFVDHEDGSFGLGEKIVYTTRGIFSETREMNVYALCSNHQTKQGRQSAMLLWRPLRAGWRSLCPQGTGSPLYLKYAVSYISPDQAKYNYDKELDRVSFDQLSARGKEIWEETIGQIRVKGGTEAQRRTFYSSLYRTYERMVDINEYGQYYSGYDGQVHISDRPFYVDDWVWDTYLAHHPLRTILDPEMQNDMLNSYTLMYEQSGWMPTFPQVHGNHMCMNSYHSAALFIDGVRKGLSDFNVEKAYEGVRKNLMEGTFIPWRQGTPRRPIDDFYHEKGYFPSLRPGKKRPNHRWMALRRGNPWQSHSGSATISGRCRSLQVNWANRMNTKNLL